MLFQAIWNQRSQTIEAILQLQNKVSEYSEKGNIITRLLVPSSKVGCILGQGGHVINEMRKRTQADIRVFSKDDKPKCAAEDEELVQVMSCDMHFYNLFCNMLLLLTSSILSFYGVLIIIIFVIRNFPL